MDDLTLSPSGSTGRRAPTPEQWAAGKALFLKGVSAEECCERFGLCLSSFRTRARREGWRRCDLPTPENPIEELDEDLPLEPSNLREIAWRWAAEAITRGDRFAARAWLRTARELRAVQQEDSRQTAEDLAKLDEEARDLADDLRSEGAEPRDVPLLRGPSDLVSDYEYRWQRNVDLHRALLEARGEPDPYPDRPRAKARLKASASVPSVPSDGDFSESGAEIADLAREAGFASLRPGSKTTGASPPGIA